MFKEKVWKYATWLTVLAFSLLIPLVFLASDGPNVAKYWRDSIGPLAMVVSFMVLLPTAFFAPAVIDGAENKKCLPAWAGGVLIYVLFGLFAHLFSGTSLYREISITWSAYIPGIIFSLNLCLIVLIQIWTAVEGLKLSLWVVLPVSGLFATWVFAALINCGDMKFVAISAVVDGLLLISLPILLTVEKCLQPKVVVKIPKTTTRCRKNHIHVM